MKGRDLKGVTERELDRRNFLKMAGAATVLGAAGVLGGNLLLGCAPTKAPEAGESKVPAGYESIRIVGSALGSEASATVIVYAALLHRHYGEIQWSSSSGAAATNAIYLTKGDIKVASHSYAAWIDTYGFDKVAESRTRSIAIPRAATAWLFLIPEDAPWKDIREAPKGLTLVPGPMGSVTPTVCEAWLNLAGLSKKDFNWVPLPAGEAADAWIQGKQSLYFTTVSGVSPAHLTMWMSPRKFKPLGMTPEQVAKAKAERTFERLGQAVSQTMLMAIAPEIFKYEVLAPVAPTPLNVRDDFPEDIAYKMAKVFDEQRQELVQIYPSARFGATPQWHIENARPPCDIHPGVAKYYREKGYLK